MTVGLFAIAEASLGQLHGKETGRKAPQKRTAKAVSDRQVAPEPR